MHAVKLSLADSGKHRWELRYAVTALGVTDSRTLLHAEESDISRQLDQFIHAIVIRNLLKVS